MFTSDLLILKIKLQSKLLAKSLNLPEKFGFDLLATSIYQHFDFNELCDSIAEFNYAENFGALSEFQKLKYLMICEVEDKELIVDLHKEIENMALRLEAKTVINISKLDLISNLYKLFGLSDESKYIINSENLELDWQPRFKTLEDESAILFCDFTINDIPTRLIATKISFDEISLEKLKFSLTQNLIQKEGSCIENHEEKLQLDMHKNWFLDTSDYLLSVDSPNSDENPCFYTINNKNYIVFGFTLSPHLQISSDNKCKSIYAQIKDIKEKQVFILNVGSEKLVLESIFLSKIVEGKDWFSTENQWIEDTILSFEDASKFPLVFNYANYLMLIRPFSHIDWLENAL